MCLSFSLWFSISPCVLFSGRIFTSTVCGKPDCTSFSTKCLQWCRGKHGPRTSTVKLVSLWAIVFLTSRFSSHLPLSTSHLLSFSTYPPFLSLPLFLPPLFFFPLYTSFTGGFGTNACLKNIAAVLTSFWRQSALDAMESDESTALEQPCFPPNQQSTAVCRFHSLLCV